MRYKIHGVGPEPIMLTTEAMSLTLHTLHITGNRAPDWLFEQYLDLLTYTMQDGPWACVGIQRGRWAP